MDITLKDPAVFPVGTTVKAYPSTNWVHAGQLPPSGAPKGASVAEAVVAAAGTIALTGLTEKTRYYAAAEVGGEWRYLAFTPVAAAVTGAAALAAVATETANREAADALRMTETAARAAFMPQSPNLLQSAALSLGRVFEASAVSPGEKQLRVARLSPSPKSGKLKKLAVFVKAKSGNLIVGLMASEEKRKSLWNSGSVAVGTAEEWQVFEPNLDVVAGQQLDAGILLDNAVATIGGEAVGLSTAAPKLPTGFLPASGALPKLAWVAAQGTFAWPAEVSEAGCANTGQIPSFIAHVE